MRNNDNKKLVLACIDSSDLHQGVCDYAAWLASRADAPLKLFHALNHHEGMHKETDLSGNLTADSRDQLLEDITTREHESGKMLIREGKQLLEKAKERVSHFGIDDPELCLRHGSVIENLLELNDNLRTLVIGARGTSHQGNESRIGGNLEGMIRSMHQPILVVNQAFKQPSTIMLAYDGSPTADRALELVALNPLYNSFVCHVVMATRRDISEEVLFAAERRLRDSGVREVISAKLEGKPEQALCQYQLDHNIDLTVMGSFSHNRLRELIRGSFTVKMLHNSNTPLLLQR